MQYAPTRPSRFSTMVWALSSGVVHDQRCGLINDRCREFESPRERFREYRWAEPTRFP